ncbi:MAG: hypothetical protein IJN95_02125 [Clostridia bacterium]|nr:hypothetical protein [Clostridia bacterium]
MKKLLAILFVVLLAFSCFTVAMVSAEEPAPLLTLDLGEGSKWKANNAGYLSNLAFLDEDGDGTKDYAQFSSFAKGGAGVVSPAFTLVAGKQYTLSFKFRIPEASKSYFFSNVAYGPTPALFRADATGDGAEVNNKATVSASPDENNIYAYTTKDMARGEDFTSTWLVGNYDPIQITDFSGISYKYYKTIFADETADMKTLLSDWTDVTCTFTAIEGDNGEDTQLVAFSIYFMDIKLDGFMFDFKDVVLKEVTCPHEYTKVEGKKDATCTEAGYTGDTVCEDCGEVVTKGTDIAAGHKIDKVAAVEATHEAAGNKEHYACSVCKKLFSDAEGKTEIAAADVVVDKIAHVYGEELKSDAQNHWKECECGSKAETAAHTFGDWKVTKEATETEKGAKEKECSVCGYKVEEEIPVVGAAVEDDKEQDKEEDKAEDTTSPETGDSTNVVFWFALLMVSALAVVTTVAAKKASVK